jgi:hypothetical protein
MKKYLILVGMLFLTGASLMAQSGLTDDQVMNYVMEQTSKGSPRSQIVTQLMKNGVSMEQIRRIQRKYQKQMNSEALGAEDITAGSQVVKNRLRENNGERREEQFERDRTNASKFRIKDTKKSNQVRNHTYNYQDRDFVQMDEAIDFMMPDSLKYFIEEEETGRKIFGHDVFNNKNLTFESSMNLATPQSYKLGPGDVVNIDIWGDSQESFTETVSPDGTITVSGIGVIQLGGLSVSQAKSRLKSAIGPRYQGSKIELTL